MAPRKASGCGLVFLIVLNWFAIFQINASPTDMRTITSLPSAFSNYHTFVPQVSYSSVIPNNVYSPSMTYLFELLNIVQEGEYPSELVRSKMNLMHYIQSTNLDLHSALINLPDISNLHPRDQLVGVLLRLQKNLPMFCQAKADVSKLVLYNMMKSYLSYVPVLEGMFPDNFAIYPSSNPNNTNYRDIIKHLLNKLRCCEKKRIISQAPEVKTEVKYIEKPAPPPEIRYIEKPAPPPQIVTQYIEKPCPTPPVPEEVTIVPTEPPFQKYIPLIPPPSNGFEKMKYKIIRDFLDRKDLSVLLGDVDMSNAANDDERLKLILKKSAQITNLDQPLIDAIKFYLNYATNMSSLNLYTQKEIRKQFELTQIFTDTLDFENLSIEGKLAFDSFYSFLLGVTGEQMKRFDTWTEVKTKGEFMQVLFTYFLEQDFTPENVKQAVIFLKPLIKMDGLGATPP